jgi:hypothetical protein
MQKFIASILLCFVIVNLFGQTNKKISTYLIAQYSTTIQDVTKGNNEAGVGLGLLAIYNGKSKIKPIIELTMDAFMGDKALRLYPNGKPIPSVSVMTNFLVGTVCQVHKRVSISIAAGPSFINPQTVLALKPSLAIYLGKTQKWIGKIAYINVFNREKVIRQDFISYSFSIGRRLF